MPEQREAVLTCATTDSAPEQTPRARREERPGLGRRRLCDLPAACPALSWPVTVLTLPSLPAPAPAPALTRNTRDLVSPELIAYLKCLIIVEVSTIMSLKLSCFLNLTGSR